jgi:hypothetical protein
MTGFAMLQLLEAAEKDRLHHSLNLGGHLLCGDAVAGLMPAARGSEDGPSLTRSASHRTQNPGFSNSYNVELGCTTNLGS